MKMEAPLMATSARENAQLGEIVGLVDVDAHR